jgi:hypothetical protein
MKKQIFTVVLNGNFDVQYHTHGRPARAAAKSLQSTMGATLRARR